MVPRGAQPPAARQWTQTGLLNLKKETTVGFYEPAGNRSLGANNQGENESRLYGEVKAAELQ